MGTEANQRVTSPASLIMPVKSWLGVQELHAIVEFTTRRSIEEADTVGTLHFARWLNLHEHNQLVFFSEFDGSLRKYIEDFAKYMGHTFDLVFKLVVNGPPLPVEKNVDAFYEWIVANNLPVLGFYSAYPTLTVQDIRARTGVAHGAVNKGIQQSPLTLVMPAKSPAHLAEVSQVITEFMPKFSETADAIGTVHFARFLALGTKALVYVSEHDGTFDKHIQDLATHLGPLFDKMFESLVDPPPTPVQQNTQAFAEWISAHNPKLWWFYSAYPVLSAPEIRALRK